VPSSPDRVETRRLGETASIVAPSILRPSAADRTNPSREQVFPRTSMAGAPAETFVSREARSSFRATRRTRPRTMRGKRNFPSPSAVVVARGSWSGSGPDGGRPIGLSSLASSGKYWKRSATAFRIFSSSSSRSTSRYGARPT